MTFFNFKNNLGQQKNHKQATTKTKNKTKTEKTRSSFLNWPARTGYPRVSNILKHFKTF